MGFFYLNGICKADNSGQCFMTIFLLCLVFCFFFPLSHLSIRVNSHHQQRHKQFSKKQLLAAGGGQSLALEYSIWFDALIARIF